MIEYFPSDYRTGRRAFIVACEHDDVDVIARVHPTAQGRDGKPLFLDTAIIGPRDAKKALLLISAVHGVEGYFGSGVQTGLMREGLARRVPCDTKIVLLHALNPYGFSWDRRVNEDNADINRNFVEFTDPPANKNHEGLAEFISPRDVSSDAMKAANAKLTAFLKEHGAMALQEAISRGQYQYPDGVYYGGAKSSWSAAMLQDVIAENLQHLSELVVIDFHTGLGEFGAAEMIVEDLPGSPGYARAHALWGDRVASSEAGESVSAPLSGTIDKAFSGWFPRTKLTIAALEVGTRDTKAVFRALRRDNWLHCFAKGRDKHPEAEAIRLELRDAFYPDTDEWKHLAWGHAVEVVESALRSLDPMGYRPPRRHP
jgi:Protein of unknown function (DUF2817)